MGISLLTAITIQSNGDDIHCETAGSDEESGKWAGAISLYRDGHLHTTLLSTKPTYKTRRTAVAAMKRLVAKIRAAELFPTKNK